jgi:uncharacterized protein YihD (DUF1040 family)
MIEEIKEDLERLESVISVGKVTSYKERLLINIVKLLLKLAEEAGIEE